MLLMDFIFSYFIARVPFHPGFRVIFLTCWETLAVSLFRGHQASTEHLSEALLFPFSLFSKSFQVPPASWLKSTLTCLSFLLFVDTHHFEYQYLCQLFSAAQKTTSEASCSKEHLFCSQICSWAKLSEASSFLFHLASGGMTWSWEVESTKGLYMYMFGSWSGLLAGTLAGAVSVGTSVGGLTVLPGLHSSQLLGWVLKVRFPREKVRGKLYLIIFPRHRSHTVVLLYSIH